MIALVLSTMLALAAAGPAGGKCCTNGCHKQCATGNKCPKPPTGEFTICLAECTTDADCGGDTTPVCDGPVCLPVPCEPGFVISGCDECGCNCNCVCEPLTCGAGFAADPVDTDGNNCPDTCEPCAVVDCLEGDILVGADANGCGGTCETPTGGGGNGGGGKSCTSNKWCCPINTICTIPRGGSEEQCVGPADGGIEDPVRC